MSQPRPHPITRRRALSGATTVGLGLPLLAACGDDGADPTAADSGNPSSASTPSATPSSAASSPGAPATETSAPAATGVVSTADVPVGGGVVLADAKVVITQPAEGDIKVFDIVCTHTGCPVGEVTDVIVCPCHGSQFDLATGEPVAGPAGAPLGAVEFTVEGDQVVLS